MIFDEPLDDYLSQLRSYSKKFFPQSILKINYLRLNRVSARIEIKKEIFIDLYFNAENERIDFSLIKNGRRIMGWDNLGGWHHHPFENPDKHIKCKAPKLAVIFQKISAMINDIG